MHTRSITAPVDDVVLHLSIEQARTLETLLALTHKRTNDERAIAAYVSLVIEQTIIGAAETVDDILPNLRDEWANAERVVSPTGGTIADIVR